MLIRKQIFIFLSLILFSTSTVHAVTEEEIRKQIADLQAQIDAIESSQGSYQFTRNLTVGSVGEDVRQLQIYLNSNGSLVAPAGAVGSPGSETTYFGARTRTALANWQFRNGVSPPVGYFGPITRARINAILGAPKPTELPITTTESPTETPPAEPIDVPPEATLPPSFDERVEHQIDSALDYDLTLLERSVQVLINEERKKFGAGELVWNAVIADVARAHSADQAADNGALTNPDVLCHYPLIRHEGIRGEYMMSDRLKVGGVSYRSAGENIVMFSTAKNLLYVYKADSPPPDCIDVPTYNIGSGTKEERLALYQEILNQSLAAVEGLEKVDWVNKEWLTYEEIGAKAVELWMNSPGHRDNILRAGFNYSGVGITRVNDYLIITQNFVGR